MAKKNDTTWCDRQEHNGTDIGEMSISQLLDIIDGTWDKLPEQLRLCARAVILTRSTGRADRKYRKVGDKGWGHGNVALS